MTQRTAHMDLEWHNPSEDAWQADLPAIPGYTNADGNDSFVTVVYDDDGSDTPWEAVATIFPSQGGVVNLDCWTMMGFDPMGESADDVMQAVDDMDVYDFSYALEGKGIEPMVDEDGEYVVASRRTAHMDLDWVSVDDSYIANMPDIPGYKFDPVQSFVSIDTEFGPTWECIFNIDGLDNVPESAAFMRWDDGVMSVWITSHDLGIRNTHTAQEMMDIIENLSPEDIAQELMNLGIEPVND